jgi:hypothetical protein
MALRVGSYINTVSFSLLSRKQARRALASNTHSTFDSHTGRYALPHNICNIDDIS